MRLRLLFLVFVLALLLGIGFSKFPTLAYERFEPAFTREEAESMIGRKVRNAQQTELIAMQCSEDGRNCERTEVGARGTVKNIRETSPNRYFIVVAWENNQSKEPMFSYCGRTTTRVSLELEQAQK